MAEWDVTQVPDDPDNGHISANEAIAEIVAGVSAPFAVDLSSGDVTLTANEYTFNFAFQCDGHSVDRALNIPAIEKHALVINDGTGAVMVKRGTGEVIVAAGDAATVYSDGTTNGLVAVSGGSGGGGGGGGLTVEEVSGGTYTPVLSDAGRYKRFTNAGGCVVTIPSNETVAFDSGTVLYLRQAAAGAVTVIGETGVTINGVDGFDDATDTQGATLALVKIDDDEWDLLGLLAEET